MGSNQSAPLATAGDNIHAGSERRPSSSASVGHISANAEEATKSEQTPTGPERGTQHLEGMALVHHRCRKRRRVYQKCVSSWYSEEFLQGKSINQEEACDEAFQIYKKCVLLGIKKEIWEKNNLPPPQPGSYLSELDEERTSK